MCFIKLNRKALNIMRGVGHLQLEESMPVVAFYLPLLYRAAIKTQVRFWGKLIVVQKSKLKHGCFGGLYKGFLGVGLGLIFLKHEAVLADTLVNSFLLRFGSPLVFFRVAKVSYFSFLSHYFGVKKYVNSINSVFLILLLSLCKNYMNIISKNIGLIKVLCSMLIKKVHANT